MFYRKFGCEFEIGHATRFFGLERKAKVFCLGYVESERSARFAVNVAHLFDALHRRRPFVHLYFGLLVRSFAIKTFLCSLR